MWFTAPALVFSTVELTKTPLLEGKIIPLTPAQTAERIIAPRLCESSTPSRIKIKGGSPFSFAWFKISSTCSTKSSRLSNWTVKIISPTEQNGNVLNILKF